MLSVGCLILNTIPLKVSTAQRLSYHGEGLHSWSAYRFCFVFFLLKKVLKSGLVGKWLCDASINGLSGQLRLQQMQNTVYIFYTVKISSKKNPLNRKDCTYLDLRVIVSSSVNLRV